jgi:replicative DNA helicase
LEPKQFRGLSVEEQRQVWHERATDTRPRISTGFPGMDHLLNRGGFAPGELVILGGRTHTRKSTVMLNMAERLLRAGTPVGFLGLDEPTASYVAKLASVFTQLPHEHLETNWESTSVQERLEEDYWPHARLLSITEGYRPSFDQMTAWLEMADVETGARPRVVFIDYVSLLARDKYTGQDVTRIPRLFEDLQVWTSAQEVVTVALHQVGRGDNRYHGDTPMRLEFLKYGGEEFADVVLATYRPQLNVIGNLDRMGAELEMGDSFDEEKWEEAVARVKRYEHSTFLQLLKNRPGVHLLQEGIELLSPTEAIYMRPAEGDTFEDGKVVPLHG